MITQEQASKMLNAEFQEKAKLTFYDELPELAYAVAARLEIKQLKSGAWRVDGKHPLGRKFRIDISEDSVSIDVH